MTSWAIELTDQAQQDLDWFRRHDRKLYLKCFDLTRALSATPTQGIGKPEPLKHEPGNVWSRRVDSEHRMIYKIFDRRIVIGSYRGHYK